MWARERDLEDFTLFLTRILRETLAGAHSRFPLFSVVPGEFCVWKFLKARNTKDEMVHGIQELRTMLEMGLAANRKAGETAAYEQMRGGMDRIDARLAAHVESLRSLGFVPDPLSIDLILI